MHFLMTQVDNLLALQPRLNGAVLIVKVGHVRDEILDHIHMWQWVDLHGLVQVTSVDLADASQCVGSADVHRAASANSFAAWPAESQCWVHFVLDLDQGVENHGSASVQVDFVRLHLWLLLGSLGVPSVDVEVLETLSSVSDSRGMDVAELKIQVDRHSGKCALCRGKSRC